jgi:peptide/nickel transport system permease protein
MKALSTFWEYVVDLNWSARFGLFIIVFFGFCATFAPWVAPYGESQIVGDVWEPIGGNFLFGTDIIGRDILSRLIYGARNTIVLALLTTACSFGLGALMGFLAATMGGWVDQVLSRIVDIIISVPTLIAALIVVSAVGTSFFVLAAVIGIIYAMPVFRIARAVAMDIEVMDYVEAARLRGEGLWWIMKREILPNAMTPLAAEFGLRFCFVFLLISGLSFLGLGLQPPLADWGAMVRSNSEGIAWGFMHPLLPASCIALLTIGINLLVDSLVHKASGLRDDH